MGGSDTQTVGYSSDVRQFLTFTLEREEYGIDILKVQEIKGYSKVTPLPNTPPYVKGVMNLRGTVVPVVDLRKRFSMGETPEDASSVVIVVMVENKVVGLLVDAVSDVLSIPLDTIHPAPELTQGLENQFIGGIAQCGDRLVTFLDIEQVLTEELGSL